MRKILILATLLVVFNGCKKDNQSGKLTPSCDGSHPTYTGAIKSILDSKCTSSGCHPGYNSYSGLSAIIQNGKFKSEIITNQTMPENSSLTQDQINKIQCWVNDGYPEN